MHHGAGCGLSGHALAHDHLEARRGTVRPWPGPAVSLPGSRSSRKSESPGRRCVSVGTQYAAACRTGPAGLAWPSSVPRSSLSWTCCRRNRAGARTSRARARRSGRRWPGSPANRTQRTPRAPRGRTGSGIPAPTTFLPVVPTRAAAQTTPGPDTRPRPPNAKAINTATPNRCFRATRTSRQFTPARNANARVIQASRYGAPPLGAAASTTSGSAVLPATFASHLADAALRQS